MIQLWTCKFTEHDLESWTTSAETLWLMEQEQLENDLETDVEIERQMARAEVVGDAECPWPWYADDPCVVIVPHIVVAEMKAFRTTCNGK